MYQAIMYYIAIAVYCGDQAIPKKIAKMNV